MAAITPLSKSRKEPHDANSYRPIALTSHLGKIMETIIKKRLHLYLDKNNLFSITQSGFRKGRSTMDQIIKLENDVKTAFQKKEKTVVIFLDVSKAFDECWRKGALLKVQQLGIGGKAFNYIMNFLTERTFCQDKQ